MKNEKPKYYRLRKDLPGISSGVRFIPVAEDRPEIFCNEMGSETYLCTRDHMEGCSAWFEPIYDN